MSGGSSATGTGLGGTVYTPEQQPAVDKSLLSVMNQFNQQGVGSNPPATYYPNAQTDLGYLAPALGGTAQTGANTALDAANTAYSNFYTPYSYLNYSYQPLAGYAGTGLDTAATLPGYASQIYSTAFDPQRASYNQGQSQTLDYANVANSAAGIGGTPYGANVTANTLTNYDLGYKAQQLKNELQGAYGGQALGSTYGGYGTAAGGAYTDIGNLGYGSAYGLSSLGYAPYSASANIGSNALKGYGDVSQLGLSSYILPQDYANQAQSYLGLGQSASGLANTIGSTNYGETALTAGGLLSGTNALLGTNSLLGGSSGIFGSGGIGSLFGSGSSASDAASLYGAAGDFSGTAAAGSTIGDIIPAASVVGS